MAAAPIEVLRFAAFTSDPAGGNPAGVVLDATGLSAVEMLAIAADVGYSETVFLVPPAGDGRRSTRYFSPEIEVPFCGHATIAAAVALAERHGPERFVLATAAGEVPVDVLHDDGLVATLTSVPTHSRPATRAELDAALDGLGWDDAALAGDLPVHVAYGGADHLIVPLASRAQLAALDYPFERLRAACAEHGWVTVHLTWREHPGRWHVRNPFPLGGVVEDPATGAAAAAFGGYLRTLDLVPPDRRVELEQGVDLGRPSQLLVELPDGDQRSRVSGRAVALR